MENKLINSKDVDLTAVMIDGVAAVLLMPPVASFAISAVRSITQLNEDQFKEKLKLFLIEADSPQENKDKFLKLLDKDADKFFSRLFKVLDRIEDEEKAKIIGRLFKALLKDEIDIGEFKELCTKLDTAYLGDLGLMTDFIREDKARQMLTDGTKIYDYVLKYDMELGEVQPLIGLGLAYEELKIKSTAQFGENDVTQSRKYLLTPTGIKLLKYGL